MDFSSTILTFDPENQEVKKAADMATLQSRIWKKSSRKILNDKRQTKLITSLRMVGENGYEYFIS
jgi:hypothetical protein